MRAAERLGNIARRDAPIGKFITVRTQFEDRLRAPIPRLEIGQREWPAGIRDSLTRFEIKRSWQIAPNSAPVVGGAAEVTKPRSREQVIRSSDIAAGVQILRVLLRLGAAAFQQDHAEPGVGELPRQSNSRGACAYNTHFGFDDAPGRDRTCIYEH